MEKMIRSLGGKNGFAFHHEGAFKKRHLRRDEQVGRKRLEKESHFNVAKFRGGHCAIRSEAEGERERRRSDTLHEARALHVRFVELFHHCQFCGMNIVVTLIQRL